MLKALAIIAGMVAFATVAQAQIVIGPALPPASFCGTYPYDPAYGCLYPENYVGRWWDGRGWHNDGWHEHWERHHQEWHHH